MTEDLRTKVSIGTGSVFTSAQKFIMAYKPEEDKDGNFVLDQGGNIAKLIKLGGVKVGTEGRVVGRPLKVQKSFLVEYQNQPGGFGVDYIEMIPVDLVEYKQMAWFPVEVVRITG